MDSPDPVASDEPHSQLEFRSKSDEKVMLMRDNTDGEYGVEADGQAFSESHSTDEQEPVIVGQENEAADNLDDSLMSGMLEVSKALDDWIDNVLQQLKANRSEVEQCEQLESNSTAIESLQATVKKCQPVIFNAEGMFQDIAQKFVIFCDALNESKVAVSKLIKSQNLQIIPSNASYDVVAQTFELNQQKHEAQSKAAECEKEITELLKTVSAIRADALECAEKAEEARAKADEVRQRAEEVQAAVERKKHDEEKSRQEALRRARLIAEEEEKKRLEEQRLLEREKAAQNGDLSESELAALHEQQEQRRREQEEKDPQNWPVFQYRFTLSPTQSLSKGECQEKLACLIRAYPKMNLEKEIFRCEVVSSIGYPLELRLGEEVASDIVKISLNEIDEHDSKKRLDYIEPLAILLPFHRSALTPSREVVIKVLQYNGKWTDLTTEQVTVEDYSDLKLAQARVKRVGIFVAVVRSKRDKISVNGDVGDIATSSTDPRVAIKFPESCFPGEATVTLQVQPIDNHAVTSLSKQAPEIYSNIYTISPILHFSLVGRRFKKPVTIQLPCAMNPKKHKKDARPKTATPKTEEKPVEETKKRVPKDKKKERRRRLMEELEAAEKSEEQRPKSAVIQPLFPKDDEENDVLHVVIKRTLDSEHWLLGESQQLVTDIHESKSEQVEFRLNEPVARVMVLRTKVQTQTHQVTQAADGIERALHKRPVHAIFRQNGKDLTECLLAICPIQRSERINKSMAERGYTFGPDAQELELHEGQSLEINFDGNIEASGWPKPEDLPLPFSYMANSKVEIELRVKEVDFYAQRSLDAYRGFIGIFHRRLVEKKVEKEFDNEHTGTKTKKWVTEKVEVVDQLGRIQIQLPKTEGKSARIRSGSAEDECDVIFDLEPDDIFDEQQLREIAVEVNDSWRRFCHALGVSDASIAAVAKKYLKMGRAADYWLCCLDCMINHWLVSLPKSANKARIMCTALRDCGYIELAEEVDDKDYLYRKDGINSAKQSQLNRAIDKILHHPSILKDWRVLGSKLGLSAGTLQQISNNGSSDLECCQMVLNNWREMVEKRKSDRRDGRQYRNPVRDLCYRLRQLRYPQLANQLEHLTVV